MNATDVPIAWVFENETDGVNFGAPILKGDSGPHYQPAEEERNWVVVGILIALIIVLWTILGVMLCVPIIRCIRSKIPVSKRRINRRYETIEGWLVTKVIRPHDNACKSIQEIFPVILHAKKSNNVSCSGCTCADETCETDSIDQEEDNMECPICMEHFAVGDIVSWSSFERCSHVFHHECIKEWLLRHNNCPFCREVFLPVDEANVNITAKVVKEMADMRSRRAETTFFCIKDGLISVSPTFFCLKDGLISVAPKMMTKRRSDIELLKEKIQSGITKADLQKLRGSRCAPKYELSEMPTLENDVGLESSDMPSSDQLDIEEQQGERLTHQIHSSDSVDEELESVPSSSDSESPETASVYLTCASSTLSNGTCDSCETVESGDGRGSTDEDCEITTMQNFATHLRLQTGEIDVRDDAAIEVFSSELDLSP